MPAFNRTLAGRNVNAVLSRTVTGPTTVSATDLNNEIVYNSSSAGDITLPSGNGLNATIDDAVYVYVAGTGVPTFVWTGGTIRSPAGLSTASQYGYMTVKWAPTGEWVQV